MAKKNILLIFSFLLTLAHSEVARGQIYTYANAKNGAPNFVNTNATGTNITAYGGSTNTPCAQGYSGRDGFNISSFSTSNPSLGIVVKPKTGYQLNITGFSVRSRRSGTGPQKIRLAYSIDGGSTWIDKGSDDAPKNNGCATSISKTNLATWNVSLTVSNTTDGIMFRIFPYGATSASGTIQLWGAFDINGTVSTTCTIPTVTVSKTDVTCNGGNDGAISLSTSGGSTPFTYSWAGPNSFSSNSKNITNLKSGIYSVIITATGGCKDTVEVTISEPAAIVPTINISANPSNVICSGTLVTFSATTGNAGSNPSYQWKLNGSNVGTNSPNYSSSSLSNGDIITCILTSNATCVNPNMATSNPVSMTVNTPVAPTINITESPNDTICVGTPVTFTATNTAGGVNPVYQWKLNGNNVGANSNTYTNSSLNNNDIVSCVLTSNANCISTATANSNNIQITTVATLTPSVSINASSINICNGTSVTFTATPVNGGANPQFQWKINGNTVGTNNNVFTTISLANNDVVTCEMTSSGACATPKTVNSNTIVMVVNPNITPGITISSTHTTVCAGTNVTFTATPTNGGASPTYQWKVNGNNVGTNSTSYSTTNLNNGDIVSCEISTTMPCASPSVASSNTIKMIINPVLPPSVSISSNNGATICTGSNVTFIATPVNGGASPSYQWKINGVSTGNNNSSYSSNSINNGDKITCVLTSNYSCAAPKTTPSNTIDMTVHPVLTPSINISASKTSICSGTSITFTANSANGGTSPKYQWKLNGNNVGANSSSYSSTSLNNGDAVTCELTSSLPCPSPAVVASNTITITVHPTVKPSIAISSSHGIQACKKQEVTFSSNSINEGSNPIYNWFKNGVSVGTNSPAYSDSNLNTGDIIKCELTSSATCAIPLQTMSNSIQMTIDSRSLSQAFISSSSNDSVCKDEVVTFHCYFTNGGVGYTFQWMKNGKDLAGSIGGTYTTDSLRNNDVIQCRFTNGFKCPLPVETQPININILTNHFPEVSINASPEPAIWGAPGSPITFNATAIDAGTNPIYQWRKNNKEIVGETGSSYSTNSLQFNDKISVIMRASGLKCIDKAFAVSNVLTMKIGTNIEDQTEEREIIVILYPNPNKGKFNITSTYLGEEFEHAFITITNIMGQIIYKSDTKLVSGKIKHQVNKDLAKGNYYLTIYLGNSKSSKAFSVLR